MPDREYRLSEGGDHCDLRFFIFKKIKEYEYI